MRGLHMVFITTCTHTRREGNTTPGKIYVILRKNVSGNKKRLQGHTTTHRPVQAVSMGSRAMTEME